MLEVYTELSTDRKHVRVMAELTDGGQDPIEVARVTAAAFADADVVAQTKLLGGVLGKWLIMELTDGQTTNVTVSDNTTNRFKN